MDLIKGRIYKIRLSNGQWTDGEFLSERHSGMGRNRHFMFRNVKTDRTIEIKSMRKIRWIPLSASETPYQEKA